MAVGIGYLELGVFRSVQSHHSKHGWQADEDARELLCCKFGENSTMVSDTEANTRAAFSIEECRH